MVSYRPGNWLGPCLRSVIDQADEVVLMDNGSPQALASEIGRRAGVRVARSAVNRGFAPAVNMGAKLAKGDLLALLNDDAVAGPGWMAAAATTLSDPSVAAVGPKLVLSTPYRQVAYDDRTWHAPGDLRPLGRQIRSVTIGTTELLARAAGPGLHRIEHDEHGAAWRWTSGPQPWYVPVPEDDGPPGAGPQGAGLGADDGTEVMVDGRPAPPGPVLHLINSAGAFLDRRGYAGDVGADTADDGSFDNRAERFGVSGCAFVTRRATWSALGPFAGRFFAYYEDADWCWRAHLAGMSIVYDPATTVEHRRSASSGGEHEPWVRVMAERNRTLTMVRNGPRRLVAKALRDRLEQGPDGGVRAGIARLLPWAVASRARLSRHWAASPDEVWRRWAGVEAPEPT